ncbi:MAG: lipid-binding SYLF domain-containing protein [Acidobacteria bacterium]|nr:lipid-binding SYLF domain-containing protein [Acidobacteriota bacterium]
MKFPVLLLAASLAGGSALAQSDVEKRLNAATMTLDEIMSVKEKSIPEDLLKKAACAVIVPGVKKGAFIIGGKFGRGFFTCRKDGGGWSAPGAVRIEGGSVGFQIGASETDVVMLVMNQRGKDSLLSSKFTIGADAAVAGGPVGRETSAATDAAMRAEILTWSRARGVFAGISLKGSTLREDEDALKELYGKKMKNKDVIATMAPPPAATSFLATLSKYAN